MNVFIGMECSDTIRSAFEREGHRAYSCDLKPNSTGAKNHYQMDVFEALSLRRRWSWDLVILHPVCQYLSVSGYWRVYYDKQRMRHVKNGILQFMRCVQVKAPRLCVENPVSIMSTRYRKPDQIFQPYDFGDDASKKTCLWLRNLPPLEIDSTLRCAGRWVLDPKTKKLVERWANQTDSGQNKLAPSDHRAADRAVFYEGPSTAMAQQWGCLK